jgi:hypothetical protein
MTTQPWLGARRGLTQAPNPANRLLRLTRQSVRLFTGQACLASVHPMSLSQPQSLPQRRALVPLVPLIHSDFIAASCSPIALHRRARAQGVLSFLDDAFRSALLFLLPHSQDYADAVSSLFQHRTLLLKIYRQMIIC